MTTLTLIGQPFPDAEAPVHIAAIRDLANAVARVAPRGCGARVLVARGETEPVGVNSHVGVHTMPVPTTMLPQLWRSGVTARPLDGEFTHAITPLAPLRSRNEDDGSQTSVLVPHALAWEAPELMGTHAKLYRNYVKRAVKLADAVLTPTHATAKVLQQQFGSQLAVRVVPLAPPHEFLAAPDSAERRDAMKLPADYHVTVATLGEHGRLALLFDALRETTCAPNLVVLCGKSTADEVREAVPQALREQVFVITPESLTDVGAVISGATLLLSPQLALGSGYEVLAAITSDVPVIASSAAANELLLDAGERADDAIDFASVLDRLAGSKTEYGRLQLLARDRARTFNWNSVAWQLWELHASL